MKGNGSTGLRAASGLVCGVWAFTVGRETQAPPTAIPPTASTPAAIVANFAMIMLLKRLFARAAAAIDAFPVAACTVESASAAGMTAPFASEERSPGRRPWPRVRRGEYRRRCEAPSGHAARPTPRRPAQPPRPVESRTAPATARRSIPRRLRRQRAFAGIARKVQSARASQDCSGRV